MTPGRGTPATALVPLVAFVCHPTLAQAHSPIEGIGTFYGHMLHIVVSPADALLLLGVALLLGQQKLGIARAGLVALAAGLVAGLATARVGMVDGAGDWPVMAGAMATGGAVGLGLRLPVATLAPAAMAAGLAIGLDSALAGVIVGTLGLALVVTGLTIGPAKEWQRIGVRIAISLIVTNSLLVLSLPPDGNARL